jgi:hypothetical protein
MQSRWALMPARGPAVMLFTLLCAAAPGPAARASVVTLALAREYTGGTSPAGAGPWVTAVFDDHGATGSVTLTVRADLSGNDEFVSRVLFNLAPAMNPAALTFSAPAKVGTFADPAGLFDVDDLNAGGGGRFDLGLSFATGQPSGRFGGTDSVTYTVSGPAALTAGSFWSLSSGSGAGGNLLASAHVQGIGPAASQSGWVSVPEPTSASVLAVGVLMLLVRRPRRAARWSESDHQR